MTSYIIRSERFMMDFTDDTPAIANIWRILKAMATAAI